MPRKKSSKKKKKPLNIKSNEVQFFIKLVMLIASITVLLAPFVNSILTNNINMKLGFSAIVWGILFLIITLNSIFKRKKQFKTLIALLLLAVTTTILFSAIPDYKYPTPYELTHSGGEYGQNMHIQLKEFLSKPIELFTLFAFFFTGLVLLANKNPEDLIKKLEKLIPESKPHKEDDIKLFAGEPTTNDLEGHSDEQLSLNTEEKKQDTTQEIIKEPKVAEPVDETEIKILNENGALADQAQSNPAQYTNWSLPPISLLHKPTIKNIDKNIYREQAQIIETTLSTFNIPTKVVNVNIGPTVVRYALQIEQGTKVSKITSLADNLALSLAVPQTSLRIETPIPGTNYIGIEIPNPDPQFVLIREGILALNKEILHKTHEYRLPMILGKTVDGHLKIEELTTLPHLLIAGTTGSGKSSGINSIIIGLLMTKRPDEVKFVMVDPKQIELALYNDIPHLLTPVITDMDLATQAFEWAVREMEKRYTMLKQAGVKQISEYHKLHGKTSMPYIVVIVDEMADLIITKKATVETPIIRLAQKARAVGIHLILATQKPSVNVITGLIKSNIPGRMSFNVANGMDSRVIMDQSGAEKLIGKGDMLYKSPSQTKPIRIQGAYTDTSEIKAVVEFIKKQVAEKNINVENDQLSLKPEEIKATVQKSNVQNELFMRAVEVILNARKASTSLLQRRLSIGYNKAANLMEELEAAGVVGHQNGSKPREILISSIEELESA